MNIKDIVNKLGLEVHQEGGFYKKTLVSDIGVNTPHCDDVRSALSSIYFMITSDQFSAFHYMKSDEVWHFYSGSPITLYIINQRGELREEIVGDEILYDNAKFQVLVPAGNWFAASVDIPNSYSLVGCDVAPGFDFRDYQLAKRDELCKKFPAHSELIKKYTQSPEEFAAATQLSEELDKKEMRHN